VENVANTKSFVVNKVTSRRQAFGRRGLASDRELGAYIFPRVLARPIAYLGKLIDDHGSLRTAAFGLVLAGSAPRGKVECTNKHHFPLW
jgi:hypothetical protein